MRSRARTARWLTVVVGALAMIAAACGGDGGGSGAPPGTSPSNPDIDLTSMGGTLPGSGATFPAAFYEEAISEFQARGSGLQVTYGGGGSGKGKQDLADQIVAWAGTDSLVKPDALGDFKGGDIFYFPTVSAPITIAYNLPGAPELDLTGDLVAGIFQREITTWDDPAIAMANPGATLPSEPIVVARRADGSGTTTNFTKYLTKAAPDSWKLGSGDTVAWPADTQAGQGNGGVAQIVKSTAGAVGYVDLSDAVASGLQVASILNKAGNFVAPSLEGASAALEGSQVNPDLTYDPLFADGPQAYPITAPTWVITYQRVDADELANLRGWLTFLLTEAQAIAADVDFAPLPESLQGRALAQVARLTAR